MDYLKRIWLSCLCPLALSVPNESYQERYSLTDSNENVGIKLSADDTFLEYNYYCRLLVLSCFQIPVIADLPVGENLQDHVSVDIRINCIPETCRPH
jgi:hypothetical protein